MRRSGIFWSDKNPTLNPKHDDLKVFPDFRLTGLNSCIFFFFFSAFVLLVRMLCEMKAAVVAICAIKTFARKFACSWPLSHILWLNLVHNETKERKHRCNPDNQLVFALCYLLAQLYLIDTN